jgi:hypothetical protein
MSKKGVFRKGVVIGIIILFIGIAVQPSIATVPLEDDEIDVDAKEYLFQTIIDIANNPDVKDLVEGNNELYTSDYDFKSVFRQILFKNPRLFFSMLFSKPSITHKYLDSSCNRGCEITNILGEDKILEIVSSAGITKTEIFNELNNIITNNEELSNRITALAEMNEILKPDSPFEDYPPKICSILAIITLGSLIIVDCIAIFSWDYEDYPIILKIFEVIATLFYCIAYISAFLFVELDCPSPFPYA